MKKTFFLNLSVILTLLVLLVLFGESSVFAQQATATPRPTFGPTCTPSPGPISTPALPVTAGSITLTPLLLAIGVFFLLTSLGAYFLNFERSRQ